MRKLSYILRHSSIIPIDVSGWAYVKDVLTVLNINKDALKDIVQTNDKQRFEFSEDKTKIRARQGHTISVDLKLPTKQPPLVLYHGTYLNVLPLIQKEGLLRKLRHHVHLTEDFNLGKTTGARYGVTVVLTIDSLQMYKDGFKFYKTDNNVWLTEHVPVKYLKNET